MIYLIAKSKVDEEKMEIDLNLEKTRRKTKKISDALHKQKER